MAASKNRALFSMAIKRHLKEYIEEAEHQDGVEYWDASLEDLIEDFSVYLHEIKDVGFSEEDEEAIASRRDDYKRDQFVIRRIRSNPRAKFRYWDNHRKVFTTEKCEASCYKTEIDAFEIARHHNLGSVIVEKFSDS